MKTITADDINKKAVREIDDSTEYDATALSAAVLYNNNEVVKLLLTNDDINVNYNYRFMTNIHLHENFFVMFTLFVYFVLPLFFIIFQFFFYSKFNFSIYTRAFPFLMIFGFIFEIQLILLKWEYPLTISSLLNIISISKTSICILDEEFTALNLACMVNNTEIANLLLAKKDIDVNAVYRNRMNGTKEDTALTFAIKNENDEVVKNLLLNQNIDVNIASKNIFQRSKDLIPISLIGILTLIILIRLLISPILFILNLIIPSIVVNYLSSKFSFVITVSNFISWFMSRFLIVNIILEITEFLSTLLYSEYDEKSPLHLALENKKIEYAKLLLNSNNIDVNAEYKSCVYNIKNALYDEVYTIKTALNMAVEMDNAEIVDLLLSNKNIDVNEKCIISTYKRIIICKFLHIAIYAIESFICSFFVSRSDRSSLDIAVANSNVEIVKKLLESNKIKDVEDEYEKLKKIKDDEQENHGNKSNEILNLLQKFISKQSTQ